MRHRLCQGMKGRGPPVYKKHYCCNQTVRRSGTPGRQEQATRRSSHSFHGLAASSVALAANEVAEPSSTTHVGTSQDRHAQRLRGCGQQRGRCDRHEDKPATAVGTAIPWEWIFPTTTAHFMDPFFLARQPTGLQDTIPAAGSLQGGR